MELEPAPDAEWYPLSSGQLGMWLVDQSGGPRTAYAVPACFELTGLLDTAALRRAFEELLARNESLRTAIADVDGTPMQRVVPDARLDWQTAAGADDALIEEFVSREFDLSAGRVLRVLLVERSGTEHTLVVAAHHIAVDGWSISVLIDQVGTAYQAFAAGRPSPLTPLPLQYKDYAVWQQAQLAEGELEGARLYWSEQLADLPDQLELPADRPRPATPSLRGATVTHTIGRDAVDALSAVCKQRKAPLFAGLTAVLRALLARYTGERDFVLGTSALTRPSMDLAEQIGYYINTLALRDTVEEGASLRTLVGSARATLLDGLRHQDYPFDRVARDTGVTARPGRTALFGVMVLLEEDWGAGSLGDVRMTRADLGNGHSKVDLTVSFRVTPTGMRVAAEYATELFDAERVQRMLTHFETLLRAALDAPDAPVDTLPLIGAAERRQVLVEFNRTDTAYELDTPVPQLFEQQVRRTPQAVATVDEQRSLTFGELNEWVNRLAWTLREEHGVGPGTLVALRMDRSVELTVAVLAVLKAGGAYLPISVDDPADRVAAIIADSAAPVLLVLDERTGNPYAEAIAVHQVGSEAPSARTDDPPPLAGPGDIAYCIYTSGSTGRPKGVLVEHRGVVNRLLWMIDDLGLDSTDTVLQKTPAVFDVSVWELLLPGVLGAKQVMLRPRCESDPIAIRSAIERHGVTTLHFVPSMLRQYLSAVPGGFAGVRRCVSSGEALDRDLADRFLAAAGDTGLYNYYGPTEATVDVTTLRVAPGPGPITLGRPAANTRIRILDGTGQPCPVGVTGELCISGVQVGRGYLNRPELTAEKFSDDPFLPGQRLYRTGDLARWLPDGEISYLGRRDGQLKLRGLRLEAGEIEQALCAQPGIDRAVVLLDGDYLCAYLVGSQCPEVAELRAELTKVLPRHMVPSHYVQTESIPVTRNGKLDREALLALGGARAATTDYVAPRTEVELALADIWSALLPAGRFGVHDDFFALGGHSLSALQLSSRIGGRFGAAVTVAGILECRTIAEQARLVAESTATDRLLEWTPRPASDRHALSYAQERMWFLRMLDPGSAAYNIRVLAKLDGPLDTGALRRAVGELVRRHEMLRTTFGSEASVAYQQVRDDLPPQFELSDLTALPAEQARAEVRDAVLREDTKPFRLEEESPLRVVLFRISGTEHALLLTLHHIAGDGWTLRLLTRELSALYQGEILPPLPQQYVDYARAVRGERYQRTVESDVDYWVTRLAGGASLDLPTDVPEPGVHSGSSGRASATVGADTGRGLRELAARSGSTLFEITMAALNLLLSRLADQRDIAVGFPVANRTAVELEGVAGLFLNTLVLRTDLGGEPGFGELLRAVSVGVREAYEHQAAPFELVVERLNPVRRLDRTPVFDVLLNYLGELREEITIDGVSVEFDEALFEPEAKFPLSFYVQEQGERTQIELVYRPDLFSPARAESMIGQLAWVLDQIAADPDAPAASYTLVPPGTAFADPALPLERPLLPPVPDLIAAHAVSAPDRIAISQGTSEITYRDLVARAESVARRLAGRGCRPGEVVGVSGERGIDFVVGLLGVLRSGATAFPLDPALPEGRKRHLVDIGRPTLVVRTDDGSDPVLDALPALRIGDAVAEDAAVPPVSPEQPAYLFFTSGTTGTPRGVLGWHGALSHFLVWQRDRFGIGAGDRCAQLTSASFDVMLRDTLLALVSGGTLVVPEAADLLGGAAVLGWAGRERITVLHAAPTVFQSWLLDAPEGTPLLPALRWLFLAGEPLKAALVRQFRDRHPGGAGIVNLYGPTETTLAKFAYPVPAGPQPPVLPVGSPLPQCQGLVLRDGVPCGVGELGEIVIRTPFRSLGYLGAPEVFVGNPHREDEDDLLYYTGDLGRYRPDGLLEIGGRKDDQLKINGVRMHPAEIENAVTGHPLVDACVVAAHRDADHEAHLVAYVVPTAEGRAAAGLADTLRTHVAGQLPWAMVPAEYLVLERIPTNANGKPDRAALPAPLFTRQDALPGAEAPGNDTERRIEDIWRGVLGRESVGVNQDFFALGGTSLKLLRLHGLLAEDFPGVFRVAQLFASPTVAGQARLVTPSLTVEDEVFEHEF
jgi:amino acid adenylation domain-containing protein